MTRLQVGAGSIGHASDYRVAVVRLHNAISRRIRSLAAAAIVALIAAAGVLVLHASTARFALATANATPAAAADNVLTIHRTAGAAIPNGFLGLSLEFKALEPYAGSNPRAIDPVALQLIRNLSPGQSPQLRIGGGSTDRTWWPVAGYRQSPGVDFVITDTWLRVAGAVARALGAHLILGINLEENSVHLAAAEARAMVKNIGAAHIDAFELGNEPELYSSWPWYKRNGQDVFGRRHGWGFADYLREYKRTAAALPRLPLAGPASGDGNAFSGGISTLLDSEPRVKVVTIHRYPLFSCNTPPSSFRFPTIKNLLSPESSLHLAATTAPTVALARGRHVELRVDEINTVSCGNAFGVGKSFASALWSLDMLFALAAAGVDGVNMHTFPGAPYNLFSFTQRANGWQASVTPEYYGLLMFADSAPAGSHMLAIDGTADPSVRTWATGGRDGHVRVVLINESPNRSRKIIVRVPGAAGAASLARLQAPSLRATDGVTFAGQSFGTGTRTGLLAGPRRVIAVADVRGSYAIAMPASSAALLTIS